MQSQNQLWKGVCEGGKSNKSETGQERSNFASFLPMSVRNCVRGDCGSITGDCKVIRADKVLLYGREYGDQIKEVLKESFGVIGCLSAVNDFVSAPQ